MSRKYLNFNEKLEQFNCRMISSLVDMTSTKKIVYECEQKHVSELSITSFTNKSRPDNMAKLFSLCAKCETRHQHEIEMQPRFDELGFTLMSVDYDKDGYRTVTYQCHCGNVSETDWRNIKKASRSSSCPKCQNDNKKVNYETLVAAFEERGCKMLMERSAYKNNKQRLSFRCVCGATAEIVYHDLVRGRLCGNCKQVRTIETNLKRYGAENPFQVDEIKEKIRNLNIERIGVEYPQQNAQVRQKTETTCMEKYGRKWAFTAPEVYTKIKNVMLERYGVEYPFQNDEILEKIRMTCLDRYGSNYYLTSETCRQKMKLAYGVEYYGMSQEFKNKILEKYGAEYFVQSEEFKRQMMEKYGVEHATQCPVLFRKACASSYGRKPYVYKDKIFMVLGYEDKGLDDILKRDGITIVYAGECDEIPTFEYYCLDGKKHIYYPDIYCPEDNRIVEVKSTWTYNKDCLKTLYKGLVVSEDYIFELRIYDNKKNICCVVEIVKGEIEKLMGADDFILGMPFK